MDSELKSERQTTQDDGPTKCEANQNENDNTGAKRQSLTIIKSRLAALAQIGEDWMYLASLGAIMALISFSMDTVITLFLNNRLWLFHDLNDDNLIVQYLGWCVPPVILVAFSTGFVHLCSPTVSVIPASPSQIQTYSQPTLH